MKKNIGKYALIGTKGLLCLLFLFAGIAKLVMSPEQMAGPVALPAAFMRFIGICEVLGGLGLVLPGLFKTHRYLTPLAAIGLSVIMVGAVVVTIMGGPAAGAVMPLVVGVLCVVVARSERTELSSRPLLAR